eukprot:jgi/Hompol1/1492/HPOL_002719-RA
MFRVAAIRSLRPVVKIPVARTFATSSIAKADAVTELYLNYLRSYKPTVVSEKVDLPTTFAAPKPPAKPEIEGADVVIAAAGEALEEEAWPALYNAIDDPANYPDAWDYSTKSESLFAKRTRSFDYDHGHGH